MSEINAESTTMPPVELRMPRASEREEMLAGKLYNSVQTPVVVRAFGLRVLERGERDDRGQARGQRRGRAPLGGQQWHLWNRV